MTALVVILPADAADAPVWLRVEDGQLVSADRPEPSADPIRTMLVAPASAVTLHRAALPDLAAKQAAAAARLMALENALGAPDTLHVASGQRDGDGAIDVAVVASGDMVRWLGWAAQEGLDAGPVVPAALLLPRPAEGYAIGEVGGERIARGASSAFAIEEGIGELLIGDAPTERVTRDDLDAALVAAIDAPPLDLRQGVFARRRRAAFDWALARRAAVLAGLILLCSLVIALITIARRDADTARLDAAALAQARQVIPGISSVAQAESALDARAASAGVGGRGFGAAAARLLSALDQSPAAALTAFEVTPDGAVRATVAAPQANDIDIVTAALRTSGVGVEATPAQALDGRQSATLTVAPR